MGGSDVYNLRYMHCAQIIEGRDTSPSTDYEKIDVNLNKGNVFGANLYLCYTRSRIFGPLTAVEVIQGRNPTVMPAGAPQTIRIDIDCNKGVPGSKYVYICYRR